MKAFYTFILLCFTLIASAQTSFLSPSSTGAHFNQWTNPTYAYTSDDQSAYCSCTGGYNKSQDYGGFHTGITGIITVQGIEVKIEGNAQTGYPGRIYISISGNNGTSWTNEKYIEFSYTGDQTYTVGASNDTWGGTWTTSSFDDANFFVKYRTVDQGGCPYHIGMDNTQIKIYYTVSSLSQNEIVTYGKKYGSGSKFYFYDKKYNSGAKLKTFDINYAYISSPPLEGYGYNPNFKLTVPQKFAIPECVRNGDYVGDFLKTRTWSLIGALSFSKASDPLIDAFAVSSTGRITINNADRIKGVLTAAKGDTTFNLLVTVTDAGYGSVVDTAKIHIKDSTLCVFVDYSAPTNGSGLRSSPKNSLANAGISTGKMYCIKRGNVAVNIKTPLHGLISSAAHPLNIGAYGSGNKPVFTSSDNICFNAEINSGQSNTTYRDEYIYFYEIIIRNCDFPAFKANRFCDHFGWYNCEFYNNDKLDIESTMMLLTDSEDTLRSFDFELLGCRFDTTSYYLQSGSGGSIDSRHFSDPSNWHVEPSFIKLGVAATITNCYFGNTPGSAFRLGYGIGSTMPRKYIKHCLINNTWPTGNVNGYGVGMQIRSDNYTVLDCKILGPFNIGVILSAAGGSQYYECQPDNVNFKNVYISGESMYGLYLADNGAGYKAFHNTLVENCRILNVPTAYKEVKGINTTIERCIFSDGSGEGILTATSSVNLKVYFNIIYGYSGASIYTPVGNNIKVYNNFLEGFATFIGATGTDFTNNFYGTLSGSGSGSNNLALGGLVTGMTFKDYANHDYHLKLSLTGANIGFTKDFDGVSFTTSPIGPYLFIP
jgi:hypothetical protein